MSQSRQLAAIMFTDIVGYTALMDEDEQRAFELLKKNRQVQRPLIEKYNGKWLKEMGDGVLASFSTVTDAVFCAAAIQKTCEDEPDLNLRIGIHQGEVVFDGEDVFGSGVNIASRLEPLAPIGGILVSESVHRNLGNKKGIASTFLREEQLKNVKEPIRIYSVQVEGAEPEAIPDLSTIPQHVSTKSRNPGKMLLAVGGVLIILLLSYFLYSNFTAKQQIADALVDVTDKSIAVLPFKNDSPDADNQYFADGMMDEILNHLQRISELGVKSRTAVEPYRNSTLSFATIAQELNVSFVLEGAVRKYGERFRVTTQLIEVESGNHLWSDTYDGIFSDTIFVIQSNIAKQIASALEVLITPEEKKVIEKFPTANVAAYEFFIKGSHEMSSYWSTGDNKHIHAARKLFDKALLIDPEYYEATNSKGATFMAERNYDSAFIYVEKLIVLDPKSSEAYQLKGECYRSMGKLDLAVESYTKAINMSSFQSTYSEFWTHIQLGQTLVRKGDIIKALSYYSKAKALQLDNEEMVWAYTYLAVVLANIGDYDRVNKYLQLSMESSLHCNQIVFFSGMLRVQGKLQQLVQLINSNFDQQACEQTCNRVMFETSIMQGKFEEAAQYWQSTGTKNYGPYFYNNNYELGYVYNQLGRTDESDKILKEEIKKLESKDNEAAGPYLHLSRIYAFQGARKKALGNLTEFAKRAVHSSWFDFLLIDPFFENLWNDPEFKSIIKQAQDEKAVIRAQVREMVERGALDL